MRATAATIWIVVIVTAVAAGQTGRPAPLDRTAVADAVARVRGRVVDAGTGRPLGRVRIRATPSRGSPDFGTSTLTDAAGTFELELQGGTYVIRASKAGYETHGYGQRDGRADTAAPLELRQGTVRTGLDFALRRGGVITGTVVDEFGEPIENATIQIARARYADWKRQLVPVSLDHAARGSTDDLGRFRIYGLPAGEYYLSASSTPLLGRASNESRDAYSLTYYPGTVEAGAAQPVRVAASQPVSGIVIPLMPGRLATISGTVQTGGLPLPSTFVNVRPHASGAMGIASAMSVRLEGNAFSLSGLPPGEYTLSVRPRAGADPPLSGSVEVVLAGENVENLVIPLTRGVTLRGRITFEGSAEHPAIPIQLSADSVDGTFAGAQDPTIQNDGTFEIKGVQGRRVLLTASARGWHAKHVRVNNADVIDDAIVIAGRDVDDIEVVLTQRLSELVGTVTDTQGRPLPSADIVAFTENRDRWKSGTRYVAAVRSDESGRFTLTSLPPERYVIVAVEGFTAGEETNPEALDRWARAGTRVTLAENGAQLVQLRGMVR
jgi:protocatechuate 3,4-dioxygenase beta subunit